MYLVTFISIMALVLFLLFTLLMSWVASMWGGQAVSEMLWMFLPQLALPAATPIGVMIWYNRKVRKMDKWQKVAEPVLSKETFLLTLAVLFLFMSAGPLFGSVVTGVTQAFGFGFGGAAAGALADQVYGIFFTLLFFAASYWGYRTVKSRNPHPRPAPARLVTGVFTLIFAVMPFAQVISAVSLLDAKVTALSLIQAVGFACLQAVPYLLIFWLVHLREKKKSKHPTEEESPDAHRLS